MVNRGIVWRAAGVLMTGLVLTLVPANAGDDKDKKAKQPGTAGQHAHKEHFEKCAKACNDCQRICDACAIHCAHLVAEGKKEHLKTLQTCLDCAEFCESAARIVARGGPFSDLICKGCAEACQRCGKACAEFKDDKMMQQCAEECFRCEKACRDMLQHVDHLNPKVKTANGTKGAIKDRANREVVPPLDK